MKKYLIKTPEDILQIPQEEPVQLEIYLKNAVIPLVEIRGNCLVRAANCEFPSLINVFGNLSLDAAGLKLPHLILVEGDCNVHEENIEIPQLTQIGGELRLFSQVSFPKLEKVGKRIKNKAKVELPTHLKIHRNNYEINSASDILSLPDNGDFDLLVKTDNVSIPHTQIHGKVTVHGNNVSFPNLITVKALFLLGENRSKPNKNIDFPVLEKVEKRCGIMAQNISMPNLIEVGDYFSVAYYGSGIFPNLQTVRGEFDYRCSQKQVFEHLRYVGGDFFCSKFDEIIIPPKEVEKKKGLLDFLGLGTTPKKEIPAVVTKPVKTSFPNLEEIGGVVALDGNHEFPKLKTAQKVNLSTHSQIFPAIKNVMFLQYSEFLDKSVDTYFPNIENIGNCLYSQKVDSLVSKIEHLFFSVTDNVCISKDEFALSSNRSGVAARLFVSRDVLFSPIKVFISILKMRHSSFQNFYAREYEREWQGSHEKINEVLGVIKQKWSKYPAYTFEDIFKIQNFFLRRFCFNYIGVSAMMQALNATRIASDGIELNYFRYDENGNKIPFTKHNIYEIYEADAAKFQELRSWGNNNRKVYAVKCWCTSTDHEHWLWIEEAYSRDPLTAIASTFRIHENVIPYIKCLKRQGDVLICEMKSEIIPKGRIRPLTKEEYFGLLEAET